MRADFPIGVTLKVGEWTITECLAGELARGRFRVRGPAGAGLLTVAPRQKLAIAELYRKLTSAAAHIAELAYIGHVETSVDRYDGMIEREPAGAPLAGRTLPAPAACALVGELCGVIARAHATGFLLDGIRPELVYVDDALHVTAIAPRCEPFLMTATSPSSGVPHCFDNLYASPEAERGPAADVFALALLFAELVGGEYPFEGYEPMQQLTAIKLHRLKPWRGPAELRELVGLALAADPKKRPTLAELANMMSNNVAGSRRV